MGLNFDVASSDMVRGGKYGSIRKDMIEFSQSGMDIAELACDYPDLLVTDFYRIAYSACRSFPTIKIIRRSDRVYLVKKGAQPCKPQ